MPAQDLIFQRLKVATDAELRAIGHALDEKIVDEPRFYIALLSKKLRADAGTAFGNLRRGDHDLPYRQILDDVVIKAASAAGWRKPTVAASASEVWLEDYIVHAFCFASKKTDASEAEKQAAREAAERSLVGKSMQYAHFGLGRAALYTATAVAGGVIGVLTVRAIEWVASPAMSRVVPAVLVLIYVRVRAEIEQALVEAV